MSVEIQGVKIIGKRLFHKYFDFMSVYECIKADGGYNYNSFRRKYYNIIYDTSGELPGDDPVSLIFHPNMRERADLFTLAENKYYSINVETLRDYFTEQYEASEKRGYDGLVSHPAYYPTKENMSNAAAEFLTKLTKERKNIFSAENAALIFLYLFLHAQAGVLPTNERSIAQLNELFDRGIEGDLTFYDPSQKNGDPLKVVRLAHSGEGDEPQTISAEGCSLRRRVARGECIYAVLKGNRAVSFLPRMTITNGIVYYTRGGKLYSRQSGGTENEVFGAANPACWTVVNGVGRILVNGKGELDRRMLGKIKVDEGARIISASSASSQYAVLLSGGSVQGDAEIPKNWEKLIYLSVGLNGGIAIDEDGRAILSSGEIIEGFKPVEACAANGHYICIDKDGNVKTDCATVVKEKVYAAAICEKGYVAAKEHEIGLYGFDGEYRRLIETEADELAALNSTVAYYAAGKMDTIQI